MIGSNTIKKSLKFNTFKYAGKDFIFKNIIDEKVKNKIIDVCENSYIVLDLDENESCDYILITIKELIKNQNNIDFYRKNILENIIINLILSQEWIRENNWFRKQLQNLQNNYYDKDYIYIIDFIYKNFYKIR